MFSAATSGYFFHQSPTRFGSKQQDYIARVQNIIASTTATIQTAVKNDQDLIALFAEILESFGAARHQIAKDHGHEDAKFFGARRDALMYTSLSDVYERYNKVLLSRLQSYLRQMPHTTKEYQTTQLKVSGKTTFNRKTSLEISVLSSEKQSEWLIPFNRGEYERICNQCSIQPLNSSTPISECFNQLFKKDILAIIKKQSIEDYKKLKIQYLLKDLYPRYPGRKSDWVLVTPRCEINQKMYALTQYVTWMYRNYVDDPVSFMTTRQDPTVISFLHQDHFLISDTLEDVAKLFKQTIEWKTGDIQELMDSVTMINYLFAHAMPYQRGSAAICEWLEMTIFAYHGYHLKYHEDFSVNMEALILPLDEFAAKYPSMVQLIALKQDKEQFLEEKNNLDSPKPGF